MSISKVTKLNRFTTLPILLDLLQRQKLTLLKPETWEDKNDSEIILEYKKRKKIQNLFAICFSHGDETIYHWKTFSNGSSGCCIEFDAPGLFKVLDGIPRLIHGKISYKKLSRVESKGVTTNRIPFTKRWPYRCEEEYRIIVTSEDESDFFDIDIPLDVINKITISQQIPDQIYKTLVNQLKSLKGDQKSRINRSTLYSNKRWINSFKK
jgi:hypothetical protein